MKYLKLCLFVLVAGTWASCSETGKQDTTTHDEDTMVIKENTTDNPTNTVTTDTTRR